MNERVMREAQFATTNEKKTAVPCSICSSSPRPPLSLSFDPFSCRAQARGDGREGKNINTIRSRRLRLEHFLLFSLIKYAYVGRFFFFFLFLRTALAFALSHSALSCTNGTDRERAHILVQPRVNRGRRRRTLTK